MTDWTRPGRMGAMLYGLAAVVVGGLATTFTRIRMAKRRGRRRAAERLPDGPIIVVCNHASYADGALLALVCRRLGRSLRLLATSGVFRAPILGGLVRRLGFIPVERGSERAADALDVAVQALEAGEAIGIFPEGRTTRDPHQWPERAKTGAVRLALLSGAPIVPIAMVGTHRVVGRDLSIGRLLRNIVLRPRVLVEVGEAIDIRSLTANPSPSADEIRVLADDVMAALVALVAEVRGEIAPDPAGVDPAPDSDADVRW